MTKSKDAPYAYDGLDRVLHERALSRHLQVLEESGYVKIEKGYEGKRPHTSCRMTGSGNKAFTKYIDVLDQVVRDAGRLPTGAAEPTGK